MQKIILDTNVIVSALISDSIPSKILFDLVFTEMVVPCLSKEVYIEYIQVLNREKFTKFSEFKNKAGIVLAKIKELSKYYQPIKIVDLLADKDDNKFLELAAISSADFLITGNASDFKIQEFEYTRIVTPREYWDNYKP